MKQKICEGCYEIFGDFLERDYCTLCEAENYSKVENGWLELNKDGGEY